MASDSQLPARSRFAITRPPSSHVRSASHRHLHARATRASDADRDAKIEQLLLVGLDHYFAAQYEQAINVWTRALFLDRSHARARAYIERARSALAERQRESEELLQNGVAAFQRGDGDEARRLLQAAIDGGAPSDEALAGARSPEPPRARAARPAPADDRRPSRRRLASRRRPPLQHRRSVASRVVARRRSHRRRGRAGGFAVGRRSGPIGGGSWPLCLPSSRAGTPAHGGRARGRRCRCRAAAKRRSLAPGRCWRAGACATRSRRSTTVRADRSAARRRRSAARRDPAAAASALATRRQCRAPAPTRRSPRSMKCPKCGYLGFEHVERCRNCGYDFSLTRRSTAFPSCTLPLDGDRERRSRSTIWRSSTRASGAAGHRP